MSKNVVNLMMCPAFIVLCSIVIGLNLLVPDVGELESLMVVPDFEQPHPVLWFRVAAIDVDLLLVVELTLVLALAENVPRWSTDESRSSTS
jgi:hypothetical protein